MKIKQISWLVVMVSALFVARANAVIYSATGTGNDGEALSASAEFVIDGVELKITLTNTGTYDPHDPVDLLAGVLFNIDGDPALTRVSVFVAPGSTMTDGGSDGGATGIGGEYGYKNGINSFGANQVVSSVGALVGAGDVFPGGDLDSPGSPNGVNYGITTLFDLVGNDNGGIAGQPFTANAVVIRLGNLPGGFSLDDISNVSFAYGTSHEIVIPEPTGFILTLAGLGLFTALRRNRS